MTTTIETLNELIQKKHLLKHPFYQAWSDGALSLDDLRFYSKQYFHHVRAFPQYLSALHSRCEDLDCRRVIAANLADEEAAQPTHPELWLNFAAGLGVDRQAVCDAAIGPKVSHLVETFQKLMRKDTREGIAALYCYEQQIPAVSQEKIRGLQLHYGITDENTIQYFRVHEAADVEHSAQWRAILEDNPLPEARLKQIAGRTLDALLGALDEIHAERNGHAGDCARIA